jgi:CMP-N,N'-diacetyllegionaminic acid synthase
MFSAPEPPCRAVLLAVIPARGGSKRLPRKNVLPLGGRPLIAWTVAAALDSGVMSEVLVSTDDAEIAQAAREAGALVPWLRPAALATDTATSGQVLAHALQWYEAGGNRCDGVVLLQPTSPFRTAHSIRGAVQTYLAAPAGNRSAVVSVYPAPVPPAWCFGLSADRELLPVLGWEAIGTRSQDLPPAYALNGAVYVLPPDAVRDGGPLLRPGTRAYVMTDPRESLDIDTPEDWRAAERWLQQTA